MMDKTLAAKSEPHKSKTFAYQQVVEDICKLGWASLSQDDVTKIAWAYYYFSVQFRESLEIARNLYPDDDRLQNLDQGERDTDNLSPWPGVAAIGERMNHDEFMRRTLELTAIPDGERHRLKAIGESYLVKVRAMARKSRALALASYEDGGLESVFRAMLMARHWSTELLQAFKHFLSEHIRFDSDPEQGHGALCRHLAPDDRAYPLWLEFKSLLIEAAPRLTGAVRVGYSASKQMVVSNDIAYY
jgi:hypothetical protein